MKWEGKLFGTDGIRGKANQEPMSVDTILRIGRAAACVFRRRQDSRHCVVIGKDTRLSGYMFETALVAGLCSMGVDAMLVGPMPTPGVSFITTSMRADAGIMISASHNPFYDNGIKFFGSDGFKLSDEIESAIERWALDRQSLDQERPDVAHVGKAKRIDDARGRYIAHLKYNFPRDLSLDGVKIVLDCAQGASYKIAPAVFTELGADVVLLGVNPNGKNINEKCGALFPENLVKATIAAEAAIGIAVDGDGDRVVLCDEKGHVFDGDDLLAILAGTMQRDGTLGNGVVGTVMSNYGLELFLRDKNIPFVRSNVGDRYVVEMMRAKGANLGGESSGHVVNLVRSTTGDGTLAALLLLGEMCRTQKPLSSYYQLFQRCPQELRTIKVDSKPPLEQLTELQSVIQSGQDKLAGHGRLLVRYSGTENSARVMVEGMDAHLIAEIANDICTSLESELGLSS